ncbi:hypothetical protein JB92DRAFT_2838074 [Gautieria morchelliformis]|nr:hypothetical protein JB92DRAFT_2838074 [Gautieria morchelliformis]
MKERLSDSVRETLSKAHPLLKKINLDPTEHYGDTPPESSTHAASSGVTEDAPSPGSCSDERIELTDYGLLEHTAVAHSDNPLDPQNVGPSGKHEGVDPTPEAVADTLSGFGCMDLDEPSKKMKKSRKKFNSEKKLSVVEAHVIGATTHEWTTHAPRFVTTEGRIISSGGQVSKVDLWAV